MNASHTFMMTIHPRKTLRIHNPLDREIKYKRMFDIDKELPLITENPEVHHSRGISDCNQCVNYLGTKITDMTCVAMSELMYYRTKLDPTNPFHVRALEGELPEVHSPRMLNIAFIILNDFLKLEGFQPTSSFVLENILDCQYQILAVGTTNKNVNWISRLKRDKLTLCALQQLCELFESDDGHCIILRSKETCLALPNPRPNNVSGAVAYQPKHIEVVTERNDLFLPPPATIDCSYITHLTPLPPAFCDDEAANMDEATLEATTLV